MPKEGAANNDLLVGSVEARNAIRWSLRLHIGRGRRYSVAEVSEGTGVPVWQLNQAMIEAEDSKHRPLPPESFMSVATFLGSSFLQGCIKPTGICVFDPPEGEVSPGQMAANNTDDNATLVRAAIDDVFDEDECPDLIEVGNRMIARGMRLRSLALTRQR